ncbi:MAG: CoA transferase [Sphingomonadaceae bacterium]|jgi:crotonobetainyl-CoA:carnitine CoA-transferase CaiB-like acyl-CoA transferase|nr:CoA transferase [Sphingomonadaceae bacterium]
MEYPEAKGGTKVAPLRGVRVVDLSRFVASPYCASILADLGAEVIRVEPALGGEDRGLVPVGGGPGGALFLQVNRNKKSLALDIRKPRARALLDRLIATCDVVVTNMPVQTLAQQKLNYTELCKIKPDIIAANTTAFGTLGSISMRGGFDGLGQAMSGAAYLAGSEEGPRRAGCSYVDYGTGLALAVGVLAALMHRNATGEGQELHSSLMTTALTFTNGWHIEAAVAGIDRAPFGNLSPNSAPSDIYQAADGHVVVQAIGSRMFASWAHLVGRPDLLEDQRFTSDSERGRHGTFLSSVMQEWIANQTVADVVHSLTENGIPCGPVYSPKQLLEDELVLESGVFTPVDVPGVSNSVPLVRPIVEFAGCDVSIREAAPSVGAQTRVILADLGLSEEDIEALIDARIAAVPA